MAKRTLNEWVDWLQARGRYTFRRDEALSISWLYLMAAYIFHLPQNNWVRGN